MNQNLNLERFEVDLSLPMVDDAVIERLRALESPDDEVPFTRQMINGFEGAVPEMIQNLKNAFESRSERDVIYWSHKLAGFSMNVGGRRFASLCQRIEVAAPAAMGVPELTKTLELILADLVVALKKY